MANQYINNMTALWNSIGTIYSAIKMNVTNAASAAGSTLLDLQIGAASKFSVDKDGNVVASGAVTATGALTATGNYITVGPATAGSIAGMARPIADGSLSLWGGVAGSTGAFFSLYGETHATKAGDIELGTNGAVRYSFDYSADTHAFKNNAGTNVLNFSSNYLLVGSSVSGSAAGMARPITDGYLALYGGAAAGTGAYIQLFGETTADGFSKDIVLGTDGNWRYRFDHDANAHIFRANALTEALEITDGGLVSVGIIESIWPENENATVGTPGNGWEAIYISGTGALHWVDYNEYSVTFVDSGGEVTLNKLHFSGAIEVFGTIAGLGSLETLGTILGPQVDTSIVNIGIFDGGPGAQNGKQITTTGLASSRSVSTAASHQTFWNTNAAQVGSISTNGTATAYTTSSDGRLKENFRSFDSGVILDAINAYQFEWKTDGKTAYGVSAQECYEVFPDAITKGSDDPQQEETDEGFEPWSADYAKFVPLLLAEIKALRARVAALEGRQ